jgi:L-rhamnose mutarotase
MGQKRNACTILVEKPEGKKSLRRHRRCWEDIKIHLREIGWSGMDSIYLIQDRERWTALVKRVMNLCAP